MLRGIITLLVFQFLGECVAKLFSLMIPGPVIGMVLLLIFLIIRKSSFSSLDSVVGFHLRYLPMILIPAAMGIITQFDTLSKELLAICISLFFGTIIAIGFSAKFMDFLTDSKEKKSGY